MTRPEPSPPRRRRRLLVVAIALVAALVLAEVALRTIAWATGRTRGVVYDEATGWRMAASVVKWGDMWSAQRPGVTNSRGWRDAEHGLARRSGVVRIVALGDSMTFGANVDYGERFTEHLEDDRTEVVNMGVCSWGTDQQLLAYEAEGRAYRPDVVLLLVTVYNDLDDIRCARSSGWSKPYFTLADGELVRHRQAVDWTVHLRGASYLAEAVFQVLERGRPSSALAPEWRDRDGLALFAALVRRLHRAVEDGGARLLVVFERPGPDEPRPIAARGRRMRAAVEAAAIATLELVFELSDERRQELHLPCGHWSPRAHRLVADQLRAELQRRGWTDG